MSNAIDQDELDAGERWPDAWILALDDDALERASSTVIVQRGQACFVSRAVRVVSEAPLPEPALLAEVSGTVIYETEVWIENDAVAGRCDCPYARDGWFCKHQVAVATAWRHRLTGQAPAMPSIDEAVRKKLDAGIKRARTLEQKQQALHEFLRRQDVSALAGKLLELADRDRSIARDLQQWRKVATVTDDPRDMKALVTEMLSPERGFLGWNECFSYVRRAEAVLPLLEQAIARDAGSGATLCMHALRRVWRVLQEADDSDGNLFGLCERIGAEWVRSLAAFGPQPAKFGDTYLQVRLDDPIGSFDSAGLEAAIGELALARYRRAVAERWRNAKDAVMAQKAKCDPSSRKTRVSEYAGELPLWRLERLHLDQLKSMGQIDEALSVLREDLSNASAHSDVVKFLEGHGRYREACTQAEQGHKAFPDDWLLQDDLLRCYERDGWTDEALALRRRQFEERPDVECYHAVLKAGRSAGKDVAVLRDELIAFVAAAELTRAWSGGAHGLRFGSANPPRASQVRNVSLRARILCSEGRWLEACALVQPPAECHVGVLQQIGTHLPPEHHEQALGLLQTVFDRSMHRATSPYQNELALVGEISRRMDSARRAAWLQQLRTDYRAKRNFIRELPAA